VTIFAIREQRTRGARSRVQSANHSSTTRRSCAARLSQVSGQPPTYKAMAEELGLTASEIQEWRSARYGVVSTLSVGAKSSRTQFAALQAVGAVRRYPRRQRALRERGFVQDMSPAAPICRWRIDTAVVDVMPTLGERLDTRIKDKRYISRRADTPHILIPARDRATKRQAGAGFSGTPHPSPQT
jgi:hypothetical protein